MPASVTPVDCQVSPSVLARMTTAMLVRPQQLVCQEQKAEVGVPFQPALSTATSSARSSFPAVCQCASLSSVATPTYLRDSSIRVPLLLSPSYSRLDGVGNRDSGDFTTNAIDLGSGLVLSSSQCRRSASQRSTSSRGSNASSVSSSAAGGFGVMGRFLSPGRRTSSGQWSSSSGGGGSFRSSQNLNRSRPSSLRSNSSAAAAYHASAVQNLASSHAPTVALRKHSSGTNQSQSSSRDLKLQDTTIAVVANGAPLVSQRSPSPVFVRHNAQPPHLTISHVESSAPPEAIDHRLISATNSDSSGELSAISLVNNANQGGSLLESLHHHAQADYPACPSPQAPLFGAACSPSFIDDVTCDGHDDTELKSSQV